MITAPHSAPPPEGIFPLNARARPQLHAQYAVWGAAEAPLPAALRPPAQGPDPATLVRSVTGAVVAVSAAMRMLNAALENSGHDRAVIDRAMAALNAAVADQTLTARRVLHRFEDEVMD